MLLLLANDTDPTVLAAVIESLSRDAIVVTDTASAGTRTDVIVTDARDEASLVRDVRAACAARGIVPTHVLGTDEEHRYAWSAALARAFGFPTLDTRVREVASDKLLQHEALAREDVRVPRLLAGANITYPNVLKSVRGMSAHEVRINRTPEELALHRHELARHPCILEEYVEGLEFSCDYAIDDSGVAVLRVVHKIPAAHGVFAGYYLFHPDEVSFGFTLAELHAVCVGAARALGLARGVCMMDFIVKDGEIVVLETTIRPGLAPHVNLMLHAYGWTSVTNLVNLAFGRAIPRSPPRGSALLCHLLTPEPGIVRSLDTVALAREAERVERYYQIGEYAEDAHGERPVSLGAAYFRNVPQSDILKKIALVARLVKAEVTGAAV